MKTILTIIFLTIASAVLAFEEPTEFKGLKFGESLKAQIPKCPYNLVNRDSTYTQVCQLAALGAHVHMLDNSGAIADVLIRSGVAGEVDEKLEYIALGFNSDRFNTVIAVFRERYGPPTDVQESTWTSKAGRTLPNTSAMWRGENIHILAKRLGNTLDRSEITISTKAWRDKNSQQNLERIKDAAKGL